jgi:multiple sugar transport system substrate-binding protein
VCSLALGVSGLSTARAQGGPDLTAGVSKAFAGKEIRLILANHPWQQAIQPLIPQFEQASGMSLRLENYFEDQLSQKLQIGLTSGQSQADAFMFRPLQEGRLFAKNGWVQDMAKYSSDAKDWKWEDFTEASRGTLTVDKFVYGIPIVTEREMIYYRKDLFEKAGLKAPATLDDLKAAAAKLTDANAGVFGIVMRGQRSPSVTQFSSFLYSFGGTWIKDGKSALDSPEALNAYKFYGGLLKDYGPQGTLNMSQPQALAIFSRARGHDRCRRVLRTGDRPQGFDRG